MDREQQKVAKEYGYRDTNGVGWKEITQNLQKQPKMTYYKSTGEPLPNLPADPLFMRKYLDRGLLLTPPEGKIWPPPEKTEVIDELTCPVCGREFGKKIALLGHMKTHKK